MHPDLYPLASELVRDRRAHAAGRRLLLPQPRPPSLRHRTAGLLIRTAAHLADEPVIVLPRRRRRPRLVRRA